MQNLATKFQRVRSSATQAHTAKNRYPARPAAAKTGNPQVIPTFEPPVDEPITIVEAHVQLGQEDSVYIRGQGSGLSWDVGQPMTYVGSDTWVWCNRNGEPGTEFKVLVNDMVWSVGPNAVLRPGGSTFVHPQFEVCVPA